MLSRQGASNIIVSAPMNAGKRIKVERDRRGWSQTDLAVRAGISQVAIKKIEAGQTRKSKFLPNIAQALDIPLSELDASIMSGDRNPTERNFKLEDEPNLLARQKAAISVSHGEQKVPDIISGTALIGEARDLPVFGTAQAGRGAMALTNEPVDWTTRPSSLLKVRDAYGVIIEGDSMSPAVEAGYTVLVHPHKKPRSGNICIFRSEAIDASFSMCIKKFERETQDHWHVMQYNPRKTFALKKSEWQTCHVVVWMGIET